MWLLFFWRTMLFRWIARSSSVQRWTQNVKDQMRVCVALEFSLILASRLSGNLAEITLPVSHTYQQNLDIYVCSFSFGGTR